MDHPLPFKEIAQRMNLRPTQVKGFYQSAMRKLRASDPDVLQTMRLIASQMHPAPYTIAKG